MRCNVDGSMSTNGAEEDFEPISRPSKGTETTATDKHVQSQTEIQAAEQVHDETRATQKACDEEFFVVDIGRRSL